MMARVFPKAVKCALRCGYRLIDTAPGFGNEEVEHEIAAPDSLDYTYI